MNRGRAAAAGTWTRCRRGLRVAVLALALPVVAGCPPSGDLALRRENARLIDALAEQDRRLGANEARLQELQRQLTEARGLSDEDFKRVFYPREIVIDKLTGGADYDGVPGDDGVTVYLKPIDAYGDVIKVAGDIRIQLYDLAAPPARNLVGEYFVPVDKVGALWHGKLFTNHFTIKCPWPGKPPANPEITVRVTFVDYLTKRVVSAQSTCRVNVPAR